MQKFPKQILLYFFLFYYERFSLTIKIIFKYNI